jgi:hypothetical protein
MKTDELVKERNLLQRKIAAIDFVLGMYPPDGNGKVDVQAETSSSSDAQTVIAKVGRVSKKNSGSPGLMESILKYLRKGGRPSSATIKNAMAKIYPDVPAKVLSQRVAATLGSLTKRSKVKRSGSKGDYKYSKK